MLLCWEIKSSLNHRHGAMCTHKIIYGIITLMLRVHMKSFLEP